MIEIRQTLNCRGRILSLHRPLIMGILNLTPDSFYDGGRYLAEADMLRRAESMLEEGAAILDLGGMSSRPGAELVAVEEELRRVLPAVRSVAGRFPEAFISVDTIRSRVAEEAVAAGAHLINDISAGAFDDGLYTTVARLGVPYILMHMQGSPKTMQQKPTYEDVAAEVLDFLIAEAGRLRALGVKDLIIDPGFGFGKSIAHNYELLRKLPLFKTLGAPLMVGVSRKSMINKVIGTRPAEALNGSTALHMAALERGASLLRVHDVKPAMEVVQLWEALNGNPANA